jgi:hypothetical protein
MNLKLSSLAAVTGLLGAAALPQAASAATNYALSADGASYVSSSSFIQQGYAGLTMDYGQMKANLLTDTPAPSISNGDTRYIFDGGDPDANIVIDLGQVRRIDSVGAGVTLPSQGDRFVTGPFTAEISKDGVHFKPYGGSVTPDLSTTNPIELFGGAKKAEFIRYDFGQSPTYFGGGGIGVGQLFANNAGVPEPATWAVMLIGLGLAGASLRQRRALAGVKA